MATQLRKSFSEITKALFKCVKQLIYRLFKYIEISHSYIIYKYHDFNYFDEMTSKLTVYVVSSAINSSGNE